MTPTELEALAILIGGRVWKGEILVPRKEPSALDMCNACALRRESYEECVALIHYLGSEQAIGCSFTAITWHVFQPPKE